ncbi:MAG TPA: hypothetical protein DD628_01885 [Clostridiales bacterium]|nr:hypothetical protein [Candidatus Apopatosoma intestinale]
MKFYPFFFAKSMDFFNYVVYNISRYIVCNISVHKRSGCKSDANPLCAKRRVCTLSERIRKSIFSGGLSKT